MPASDTTAFWLSPLCLSVAVSAYLLPASLPWTIVSWTVVSARASGLSGDRLLLSEVSEVGITVTISISLKSVN